MLFLDEIRYMRLYGSKRKVFIPIDPTNRKKGAAIMLLGKNSVDSHTMMNLPYLYNPKLYESLYIDRNVNAFIDSGAIVDDDEEELAVNEAMRHLPMNKDIVISIDCKTSSINDLKKLKEVFNEKTVYKWFKFFRVPNGSIPAEITIKAYPDQKEMAKEHQKDALENKEVIGASYSYDDTIVCVTYSGYQPLEGKNGTYEQYLLNELISFVCMKASKKCDRYLADQIATALCGQIDDKLDDKITNHYDEIDDYALVTAYTIKKMYKEEGPSSIIRLCKTGDYSLLAKYTTKNLIRRIKKIYAEDTLSSADRKALKDSDFGLPDKKKYPMPDESHVRSAIRFFNHVSSEDEAELARNIKKKIKQFGMTVNVGEENRFSKYYNESYTVINNVCTYQPAIPFLESVGNHKDEIEVFNRLNATEKDFISFGYDFRRMPDNAIIYRYIEYDENKGLFGKRRPKGFIHVNTDKYCDQLRDDDTGQVTIAIDSDYRGTGLSTKLVGKMLAEVRKENPNLSNIIWRANYNNPVSIKLAEKSGFRRIREDQHDVTFCYYFEEDPDYKDLPDILTEVQALNWAKKMKLVPSEFDKRTSFRSVRDIVKSNKASSTEICCVLHKVLNRMHLWNAVITLNDIDTKANKSKSYSVICYTYDFKTFYMIDPFTKQLLRLNNTSNFQDVINISTDIILDRAKLKVTSDTTIVRSVSDFLSLPYEKTLWKQFKLDGQLNESSLLETSLKSTIDDDFKAKGKKKLSSFKKCKINKDFIDKYKAQYKFLKHIDPNDEAVCWMDKADSIVGLVAVEDKGNDIHYITALEVAKEYQGYGLGKQILDYAINNMKGNALTVYKNNEVAIRMYEKAGFKKDGKNYRGSYRMYLPGTRHLKESAFLEASMPSLKDDKELYEWTVKNIKYKKYHVLMTAEEVEKEKAGSCHDQTIFLKEALKTIPGISNVKSWFIIEYDESGKMDIGDPWQHSVVTYTKDNKDYYMETAWWVFKGIHSLGSKSIQEYYEDMHKNKKWGNIDKCPIIQVSKFKGETGMGIKQLMEVNAPNIKWHGEETSVSESAFLESAPIPSHDTESLFPDVMTIIKALSEKERKDIAINGDYKDSPNVINRCIKRDESGNPIGFIDCYCFKKSPYEAKLTAAMHPHHRHKGHMKHLLQDVIRQSPVRNPHIRRYVWHVDPENISSIKVAQSCGFVKDNRYHRYRPDLDIYEDGYVYDIPFKEQCNDFDRIPLPQKLLRESFGSDEYVCTEDYLLTDNFITFFNGMDNQVISEAEKKYDSKLKRYLYKERLKNNKAVLMRYQEMKAMNPWIKRTFLKLSQYQRRNLFIDLSFYHGLFLKNLQFKKDVAVKMYWDFLNRLINDSEYKALYPKITIFIPVWADAWDVKSAEELMDYKQSINPISMIIRMLRKNPQELKKWGNKDIVFVSPNGYFKINFNNFDTKNLSRLRIFITKLVNNEIIEDDENEDGYSTEDTDSAAVITANIVDKVEKNAGIKIDDITGGTDNDHKPEEVGVLKAKNDFTHLRVRAEKIHLIKSNPENSEKVKNAVLILATNGDTAAETFMNNQIDATIFSKRGYYAP